MTGSLLYLTNTRTNIMYSVGLCDRFQSSLKESHLNFIKRIYKYLKGTQGLFLWYPAGYIFYLIRYFNANYIEYLVDIRSTYGMTQFLGPCLVSWATKT